MKRELVKSFRTVALLAMFSEDSTTSNNISSCLKWMSLMEPDLILYPILERAVPSLEALVEVGVDLKSIKDTFTDSAYTDTAYHSRNQSIWVPLLRHSCLGRSTIQGRST
jgi:hypothetical protein